jgi:2-polyprenyl-6-methoxyphenol hydroxylase-like FAD-dependent oxidoreductase
MIALWPDIAPLAAQLTDPGQLVFARYRHHTMGRPAGLRVVHVGDAAHATSPQLGQGANMALLDARALALAIERNADLDEAFRTYMALRRHHVRLYQTLSWLFTPVYQSHSRVVPLLRDRLFAPVSRLPGIAPLMAALVAGTLIDPRQRLALTPPHP